MKDIKEVFAKNLSELRAQSGMTQAELGEKLNYSDKTISKWERAESLPDASVLKEVAGIFGVQLDYLLEEEHSSTADSASEKDSKKKDKKKNKEPKKPREKRDDISKAELEKHVRRVSVTGVWLAAIIFFIVIWIVLDKTWWIILVWAVPISALLGLIFNSIWGTEKAKKNFWYVTALVTSIIIAIFATLAAVGKVYGQIFLVLIPSEILIYLVFKFYGAIHSKNT